MATVPVNKSTVVLTAREWKSTLATVKNEGRDEWEPYAGAILAAIETGYLDDHLQTLAQHMRQRWLHLEDPSKPGPTYVPVDAAEGVVSDYVPGNTPLLGKDFKLNPSNRDIGTDGPINRREYRAHGHAYLKDDIIGKYVKINWPKPQASNIWKVTATLRTQFRAVLVYSDHPNAKIGMEQAFKFDFNKYMFNL